MIATSGEATVGEAMKWRYAILTSISEGDDLEVDLKFTHERPTWARPTPKSLFDCLEQLGDHEWELVSTVPMGSMSMGGTKATQGYEGIKLGLLNAVTGGQLRRTVGETWTQEHVGAFMMVFRRPMSGHSSDSPAHQPEPASVPAGPPPAAPSNSDFAGLQRGRRPSWTE